jgi:hypothetical protein
MSFGSIPRKRKSREDRCGYRRRMRLQNGRRLDRRRQAGRTCRSRPGQGQGHNRLLGSGLDGDYRRATASFSIWPTITCAISKESWPHWTVISLQRCSPTPGLGLCSKPFRASTRPQEDDHRPPTNWCGPPSASLFGANLIATQLSITKLRASPRTPRAGSEPSRNTGRSPLQACRSRRPQADPSCTPHIGIWGPSITQLQRRRACPVTTSAIRLAERDAPRAIARPPPHPLSR